MINIGDRFGRWTVIGPSKKTDKSQNKYFLCKCDCGTARDIAGYMLASGRSKSCGCVRTKDMTGEKVGHLTFLKVARIGEGGRRIWLCQCDCGNYVEKTINQAKYSPSCGCARECAARETLKKNGKKLRRIEGTCIDSFHQNLSKNNKSGIKGVSWDKKRQKWAAQITFKRKVYNLGRYDTKEDAAKARQDAEKKFFGEFEKYYQENHAKKKAQE